MDEVTWGALALTLTVVGAIYTWWAWRHRGAAAGTRGAALTLLPAAAWLTGTLEMFTEIAGSVADWATHLVLSPVVWSGVGLFGLSVALFLTSSLLRGRQAPGGSAGEPRVPRSGEPAPLKSPRARQAPAIDDDLADIEALLRKRGIN